MVIRASALSADLVTDFFESKRVILTEDSIDSIERDIPEETRILSTLEASRQGTILDFRVLSAGQSEGMAVLAGILDALQQYMKYIYKSPVARVYDASVSLDSREMLVFRLADGLYRYVNVLRPPAYAESAARSDGALFIAAAGVSGFAAICFVLLLPVLTGVQVLWKHSKRNK